MNNNEMLRLKDIFKRIVAILIVGILIWNFIVYLNDLFIEQEYNPLARFIFAFMTTFLTVALIQVALHFGKLSWKQLGLTTIKRNFFSFLLGFFL